MMKPTLLIAVALLFTILAFENCGTAATTSNANIVSGATSSAVAGHACPVYNTPTCSMGSLVDTPDVEGCSQFACVSGQTYSCPTYTMPNCSSEQIPTEIMDANGCDVKKCMPANQF